MKKYFLHDGFKQDGPFDIEDLKSKNLSKDTPIWFEGLTDWTTIGELEELKELITPTPPPLVPKIVTPPPVQKSIPQQDVTVNVPKKNNSTARTLLILLGVIVLALLGVFIYKQIEHQQYQHERETTTNSEEDAKKMVKENITSYVKAKRNEYNYSELGGISNLKITVTNTSDYVIDQVQVNVTYLKANGEVWDSKLINFNLLDPNTMKTIGIEDTQRGTSIKYEIVSIKSAALGLN